MSKHRAMGSHHSARSQTTEWLTPPEIIQKLGPFDLDPCSPTKRPWDTARRHYTVKDAGLRRAWHGRVWLNPPYGLGAAKWMDRLSSHGNGIAMLFARTETRLFFEYVWPKASGILFVQGRLHFYTPDGTRARRNSGAPSVLVAYDRAGSQNRDALRISGLGAYIELSKGR